MCGIAGMVYRDHRRPVDAELLRSMGAAIAHRGPDAEGTWSAPGVGLVHRRLAIIDLEGGDQPIGNEDGSVQVVFNGEIYNFQELRRELQERGHRFSTSTDTEVLVHLYEEQGERLVERLRGMFAFAIWDHRERRLLLARDRIGQKPLYVYRDAEKLLFGSEVKAILAYPGVDRRVDPQGVEDYLALGMLPGERSIFQGVRKVPPGHTLSVTAATIDADPRCYWRWNPRPPAREYSLADWQEAVSSKIDETVRLHTVADVPVGAFLSGGLDSSLVVSHLAEQSSQPVHAFSIGFPDARFSELPFAREVAQRFGCRHVEETVTPAAALNLDELVRVYDEPFADTSAIPMLWVSRLASRSVKVVLSGDGGDEAFGGYARYAHDLREAALRNRLPGWFRRGALGPLATVWPKADWLPRVLRLKTLLTNLSLEPDQAYANTVALCRNPMRRQLLSRELLKDLGDHRPEAAIVKGFSGANRADTLACMLSADIGCLLPDGFLTKVDRASMAFGLEVRPPLVDHELLELAAQIPSDLKVCRGQTKWILKRTYEGRLPAGAVRRAKHGFEMPIDGWLRGPLRDVFESSVLAPGSLVGHLINQPAVRRLYRAHLARSGRHGGVLWSVLVLARWADEYLGSGSFAGRPTITALQSLNV